MNNEAKIAKQASQARLDEWDIIHHGKVATMSIG